MPPKCFDTPLHPNAHVALSVGAVGAQRSARCRGHRTLDVHDRGGIDGELHRRGTLQEDRAEHVGSLEQLAGGAVEADLTLLHEVRGLGDGQGDVHRLLHQDHRGALLLEPLHRHEELGDHARRQAERELVDHQQARARQQRHGEGEHLLLATAEVGGGLLHPVLERREHLQHVRDGLRAAGLVTIEPARQPQVLVDGQRREHPLPARDHDDAAGGDLVGRGVGGVAPVEHDRPAVGGHHAGDGLQERRLPCAVGAEQRHDLALVDLEVHAEEHLDVVVAHVDVADEQQLHLAPRSLEADLGLGRGRGPHPADVGLHERASRRQDGRADQEDRDHDQHALPDPVAIGDAADDVEHGEPRQDEQRCHREPE